MNNKDMSIYPVYEDTDTLHQGLTKREYFAGLAMQGLYAGDRDNGFDAEGVAAYAVQTADALLKALEESNNEH